MNIITSFQKRKEKKRNLGHVFLPINTLNFLFVLLQPNMLQNFSFYSKGGILKDENKIIHAYVLDF